MSASSPAELGNEAQATQAGMDSTERDWLAPAVLLVLLLAMQLYLVYFKSFNWDEFLHYSQVYAARNGTLSAPFQVLHSRILFWAPDAAESLVAQLRLARLFMWACTLGTLAAIYGLARQFTSHTSALYAALAYLTAGFVFTQSFSIRADPMAAATLMGSVYLFASGRLTLGRAIAVGALIGLAGMITLKSVFYAPCFAGIAWWRHRNGDGDFKLFINLALMLLAALVSFGLIYTLHKSGLAEVPERFSNPASLLRNGSRWFFAEDKFPLFYLGKQLLFAIVFVICLFLAPFAWKRGIADRSARIAFIGLAAPLLVLLVYRNTFPYFFVFLFAPVAVAIAPGVEMLRRRYGHPAMLLLFSTAPLALTSIEPRGVIARQEAMIQYIHREYPRPVGYLDRSGAIADYPRAIEHLTTGNGISGYYMRGDPTVAKKIKKGEVAFVLATASSIVAALKGKPIPNTFLPDDVKLLSTNYVQQWGPLFREGKYVPAGENPVGLTVPYTGPYTLDGGELEIDGRRVRPGQTIVLSEGVHKIIGPREHRAILWRGEKLPSPPPMNWAGGFYTDF